MEKKIVMLNCLQDFEATNPNQLSFKKEEKLILENSMNDNWWVAKNPITKKRGYVPSNHVIKLVDESFTQQEEKLVTNQERISSPIKKEDPKLSSTPPTVNNNEKNESSNDTKTIMVFFFMFFLNSLI